MNIGHFTTVQWTFVHGTWNQKYTACSDRGYTRQARRKKIPQRRSADVELGIESIDGGASKVQEALVPRERIDDKKRLYVDREVY